MSDADRSAKRSYFQDATVSWEGRAYHFRAEDGSALESGSADWHGPADPSTWLAVLAFLHARQLVGEAGDAVALDLAAQAMGISAAHLRGSIEWHENYMRWHDGDHEYRIL